MVEKELSEADMELFIRLMHPIPEEQDGSCPRIEWMGEDLGHCPGVGEWKCQLQEFRYGDLLYGGGDECKDYKPCNSSNHQSCPHYLKSVRK